MVSTSESGWTPGMSRYPSYWPRTTRVGSSGSIASNTRCFSAASASALKPAGVSIATNPRAWNRWVTTMSRNAPVSS